MTLLETLITILRSIALVNNYCLVVKINPNSHAQFMLEITLILPILALKHKYTEARINVAPYITPQTDKRVV
jgi:hypothetical protein